MGEPFSTGAIGFVIGALVTAVIFLLVQKRQPSPSFSPMLEEPVQTEEEKAKMAEEIKKLSGRINGSRTMWD